MALSRLLVVSALMLVIGWIWTGTRTAQAAPVLSEPYAITAGADGSMWFTEPYADRIGRITPAGVITEFTRGVSRGSLPWAITGGPDRNVWFTERFAGRIGRISPDGVITEFSCGISADQGWGIAPGPDSNVWFTETEANRVGRITPRGDVQTFPTGLRWEGPDGIAAGPDGNLWFTGDFEPRVGRISPAGLLARPVLIPQDTGLAGGIARAPDGNMWLTSYGPLIARVSADLLVTEFTRGLPSLVDLGSGVAAGGDGNMWFTEGTGWRIGRISPSGVISEFPVTGEFRRVRQFGMRVAARRARGGSLFDRQKGVAFRPWLTG